MDQRIPEPLRELVAQLARLPGLGPKSAMRVAMVLLKWPEGETRRLGASIHELRDKLRLCSRCGALSEADPCSICADPSRDEALLCVVTEWDSMLTLEEGGFFRGQYFILGGLVPVADMNGEHTELDRLLARLGEGRVRELVLGLGATVEAESSAAFIRGLVSRRFPAVRITRLAQGIPLGAEIKFMDRETLRQSLRYRQENF